MKIISSDYSRTFTITGLPALPYNDLRQLEITIQYTGEACMKKSELLDGIVVPLIRTALAMDTSEATVVDGDKRYSCMELALAIQAMKERHEVRGLRARVAELEAQIKGNPCI